MHVAFHRASCEVDRRHIDYVGLSSVHQETEDLDSSLLVMFEMYIADENDDVCFNEISLSVGEELSGSGRQEMLVLDSSHIAYMESE